LPNGSAAEDEDGNPRGARAKANAPGGGLLVADNGAIAEATASPTLETFLDERASIQAGGDVSLLASANNDASAQGDGFTISLGAGLGKSEADATASGGSAAFIGANPFDAERRRG
jgi:hypothetical protein